MPSRLPRLRHYLGMSPFLPLSPFLPSRLPTFFILFPFSPLERKVIDPQNYRNYGDISDKLYLLRRILKS